MYRKQKLGLRRKKNKKKKESLRKKCESTHSHWSLPFTLFYLSNLFFFFFVYFERISTNFILLICQNKEEQNYFLMYTFSLIFSFLNAKIKFDFIFGPHLSEMEEANNCQRIASARIQWT